MSKPTFISLSFYPIRKREVDHLRARHKTDKAMYMGLERNFRIIFVGHRHFDVKLRSTEKEKYFPYGHFFFSVPLRTLLYLRKLNPAAVLVHSFNYPFQTLLVKWLVPKRTRLLVQHHAEKPLKNPLKRWLQRVCFHDFNQFFFAASGLAEPFVLKRIIGSRTRIIEMMEISSSLKIKSREESLRFLELTESGFLLWVGRLNQNKDPMTVLKAVKAASVKGSIPALYMIFSTGEMLDEIKGFLAQEQISHLVKLVGPVAHERLAYWFSAAGYFIAASHYEGSGLALCEAMGCGCVPIVTDIPSFRAMTRQGECAYLYETENHLQLAGILCSLDDRSREMLSNKALAVFQEDLSIEAIARKLNNAVTAGTTA